LSDNIFQKLTDRYPFITVISHGNSEYIGIVQNRDTIVTNFYDFGAIKNGDLKRQFLELGEQWWWESNRQIPINIFLREEWGVYRQVLRSFNSKDVSILHGPVVSLSDLALKKSKRRSITLVRKINS
jgi:hypothetical protein